MKTGTDRYQLQKNKLIQVKQDVSSLIMKAKSIPGVSDSLFSGWEKMCDTFEEEVSKDIIRVAVVGPIKSGKSTFLNAILRKDYLKRGAGVVTSIVTRIRCGQSLRAKLFFKSWQEVNMDMVQALVLLPLSGWQAESRTFDIRNKQDRDDLQQAMSDLSMDQMITHDTRNANSVLLLSYLKGYDKIKNIVSTENIVKEYGKKRFPEHRKFVADDSLSVYLKDIELEINSAVTDSIIELADCQGSDSSNPLHLSMIQDYLLLTHFIIYVISSRTGLRQADIKFLSMIKKLGIIENILFIVNCDISEHESVSELKTLIGKITEELEIIIPNPNIYTFSSLLNIFKAQGKKLPLKDRQRLNNWKGQKKIVALSNRETKRFESFFYDKLTREKSTLLLKNHLERLGVVMEGIESWTNMNHDILSREEDEIKRLAEKVRFHQNKIKQVRTMIKNTLDGAVPKIKSELKTEIDRFFDFNSGQAVAGIIEFVHAYTLPLNSYEDIIKNSGFSHALYVIYQDFKFALDTFMAETVNPEIISFIGKTEKRIQNYFEEVAKPYILMAQDEFHDYEDTMAAFGIELNRNRSGFFRLTDLNSIKGIAGIKFTPVNSSMRYSARIKSEAIMRFGFYSALRLLRKILKKPLPANKKEEILALNDGMRRIKRETEKSIIAHFKDYKENIKFQYFFKLMDSVVNALNDTLREQIEVYSSDLLVILDRVNTQKIDKTRALDTLQSMVASASMIIGRVTTLRDEIDGSK